MRKTAKVLLTTVLLAAWLPGCCATSGRTDPPLPTDAVGWKDFEEEYAHYSAGSDSPKTLVYETIKYRGRFLLRNGEQTDNGRLQIKVLELMPPHCFVEQGDPAARARVKLEFRVLSDPDHPCSYVCPDHDFNLRLDCHGLNHELEILGVKVRSINLKDGWVSFDLTEKTEPD
jgi:hypothetical protein